MKIKITNSITQLKNHNTKLTAHIEQAEAQYNTMTNASCEARGLSGKGYEAIDERMQMRPFVISAHIACFSAIRSANEKNIALLSKLPSSLKDPHTVDTNECQEEIERLQGEIVDLERDLQIAYQAEISRQSSTWLFWDPAPMQKIYSFYNGLIKIAGDLIIKWQDIQRAANEYNSASSGLYTDASTAVNTLLTNSTAAVKGCIENNGYSAEAVKLMKKSFAEYRLKLAEQYCTPQEIAALKRAAEEGGITKESIYSKDGTFNEDLYSALTKLPGYFVTQDDVEAIAGAYSNMWTAEDGPDTDVIERMIELSYVVIPGETVFARFSPYAPEQEFLLFEQSPLLGRVSNEMQVIFVGINQSEMGNDDFQRMLAGTNLLGILAQDTRRFQGLPKGIEVSLGIADKKFRGNITAVLCELVVNPARFDQASWAKRFNQDDGSATPSHSFLSATGQMHSVSAAMERVKKNGVLDTGFEVHGFFAKSAVNTTLLTAGKKLNPIVTVAFGIFDVLNEVERVENTRVAADPTYDAITEDAPRGGAMGLGSYAFNLQIGRSSGPDAYLEFQPKVYFTNNNREAFDSLCTSYNHYNEYQRGIRPSDLADRRPPFTASDYITEVERNPLRAIIGPTDELPLGGSHPSFFEDRTSSFLKWSDKPAELVWTKDNTDSRGIPGQPVEGTGLTNYTFSTNRKGNSNYQFAWEYKK